MSIREEIAQTFQTWHGNCDWEDASQEERDDYRADAKEILSLIIGEIEKVVIAEWIYGVVSKEVTLFIEEYAVDVHKPRQWNRLPDEAKEYWYRYGEQAIEAVINMLRE